MLFGVDGTWLTTRRIEGQFPKVDELRPKEFTHEVTIPREELLDVVRRTSVMAHRNSPLRLRFAEGELTVWTQTQDVGRPVRRSRFASRASRSRSASTRTSCATGSSPPRATRSASA